MNALSDLLALEQDDRTPLFLVEPPDGRKLIAELPRQRTFLNTLRIVAPQVYARAIPNAGKRNPRLAKLEGITAGLFDVQCTWNHGCAEVEFKGYDKNGRPGKLSLAQIEHGNRMTRLGFSVGCFFDEMNAITWLQSLGAPVRLNALEALRP